MNDNNAIYPNWRCSGNKHVNMEIEIEYLQPLIYYHAYNCMIGSGWIISFVIFIWFNIRSYKLSRYIVHISRHAATRDPVWTLIRSERHPFSYWKKRFISKCNFYGNYLLLNWQLLVNKFLLISNLYNHTETNIL